MACLLFLTPLSQRDLNTLKTTLCQRFSRLLQLKKIGETSKRLQKNPREDELKEGWVTFKVLKNIPCRKKNISLLVLLCSLQHG